MNKSFLAAILVAASLAPVSGAGEEGFVALFNGKDTTGWHLRKPDGQLDNEVDQPGQIFLQGDHGTVWFRNLRIKELKK